MSKVLAFIGGTGQGKTTLSKKMVKMLDPENKKNITFDVNNEHQDLNAIFPDKQLLLDLIQNSKGKIFYIEDATAFFTNNAKDSILHQELVAKRHTKNCFILLFHSLTDYPRYILSLTNYMFLFNTIESTKSVLRKFDGMEKITEAFLKTRNNKVGEYETIRLL